MRRHLVAAVTLVALCAALVPAASASAAPASNDEFENAMPITGNQGSASIDAEGASADPSDPPQTEGLWSLWYRWTAPTTGWYRFWVDNVDTTECFGNASVFQGDSVDSLAVRSHPSYLDWYGSSRAGFVCAVGGQSYVIAAGLDCGFVTLKWERRGPLIVTVLGPDGLAEPGVVTEPLECHQGYCYGSDFGYAFTNAAGRAYVHIFNDDSRWKLELRPDSLNVAPRRVAVAMPQTTGAVSATRSLRAMPAVDLDQDGLGDVVSGVPLADRGRGNAGAVVVRFGDGRRRVLDEASTGLPSDRIRGEQFGAAVSTADVDNDGWTDLTIGAPGEMVGTIRSGAIFIVFGSAKGLGNGRASLRSHQNSAGIAGSASQGDRFGAAVAPDVTRRYTHFVVGAPGKDSGGQANSGAVVRFTLFRPDPSRGPESKVWYQGTPGVGGTNAPGDRFGSALAIGGFATKSSQFGGDPPPPWPSLAIGVPGKDVAGARDAGAIVVLRAVDSGPNYAESGNPLITQNDVTVVPGEGAGAGHAFGSVLVAFREQIPLDADARDRLAVGALGEGGGTVTVLSSGHKQLLLFAPAADNTRLVQGVDGVPGGDEAGDRFGAALAVGDVNDDSSIGVWRHPGEQSEGEPDLIVGAPGEEVADHAGSGSVTLLYGARSSDTPTQWVVAGGGVVRPGRAGVPGRPTAGARFGSSVAALDVDGNGYPDVVGGAPGIDATVTNGGAVYAGHHHIDGLQGGRVMLWPEALANDGFGAQLAAPQLFFSQG